MAILRNSIIVSGWTAASRVLGFARDLLIANKLGAGMASDAFFIALQLPNLLRRLLAEGAFNVAFVPLLAQEQTQDQAKARQFAEAVLGWMFVTGLGLSFAGVLAMPWVVALLVPGWLDDPVKMELTVALGRITFPYLFLISMAAFMGSVCNTAGRFAAYAMVPALLNISFIFGLLVYPEFGISPASAAAWSVPVGGIAQVLFMWMEMRRAGYRLRLTLPRKHPLLMPMLARMGPAALGVGVLQLSILIDNFVASYISEGTVTYLQMANRFYQMPLALIGIAVATVLLPHLSTLLGRGDNSGARQAFVSSMVACLTLAVGATTGLLLLAPELMTTLLHHGDYTEFAALSTAWAMMGYVVGLPAYIFTKLTAPAFFASNQPAMPVKASAVALAVNLACNVLFVFLLLRMGYNDMAHVGIALATAVGGYANGGLQWYWLKKQGTFQLGKAPLLKPLAKLAMVAAAMAATLLCIKLALPYNMDGSLIVRLGWLVLAGGLGGLVFVLAVEKTGLLSVHQLLKQLRRA